MPRRSVNVVSFLLVAASAVSIARAQRVEQPAPTPEIPPGAALVAIDSLPGPDTWPAGKALTTDTDHERRIRARLEEPFTHDFTGMTLADLVPLLEKRLQCTVVLDEAALLAEDRSPEKVELHGKAQGRGLRKELRALLDPRGLKAFVHNDCYFITTTTAAETYDEIRVYQVHDLVIAADDLIAGNPDFETLGQIIRVQVFDESWRIHGGTMGELRSFRGPGVYALVIAHTAETHERIEEFLNQLREAKVPEVAELQRTPVGEEPQRNLVGGSAFGGLEGSVLYLHGPPLPPPPRLPRGKVFFQQTTAERRLQEVLRKPAEFAFDNARLDAIAETVAKQYGIPVELDLGALTADGKGPDSEVSLEWKSGSLAAALYAILNQHGLTFAFRNDAVLLTTKTAAETFEEVRIYQVHDLLECDATRIGGRASFDVFNEMITAIVSPETWRDGSGTSVDVLGFEAPGIQCLSIVQTADVHQDIESLLDMLRDAFVPEVYEAQRRRPVVVRPAQAAAGER